MQNLLITGHKGTIGSILYRNLSQYHHVTGLDLPESDVRDYETVDTHMSGIDVVIHVAHSQKPSWRENYRSGYIDPDNTTMEMNVLEAARSHNVNRVIMASSVHADNYELLSQDQKLLTTPGSYQPDSPYGAHKLILESVGAHYARQGYLSFIGVRFGGVDSVNTPPSHPDRPCVWLSHRDLTYAITACINAAAVPNNYAVFYAVSDSAGRVHDWSNPFGWEPMDCIN